MKRIRLTALSLSTVLCLGCPFDDEPDPERAAVTDGTGGGEDGGTEQPVDLGLAINELMASNDTGALDEMGEADDWIELINRGDKKLNLKNFTLIDSLLKAPIALPDEALDPGEVVILWADNDPEQGDLHLPFKLDKDGDGLWLRDSDGVLGDQVEYEALPADESFARHPDGDGDWDFCDSPSPGALNGASCK